MKRTTSIGAALLTGLALAGQASAQQPAPPPAVATATPIAPAAPPAAQTAPPPGFQPAPQGAPPPAGDAWDAAIAKTAHQEKLFETDEERDRRAERLERDSLSGGYARGRIGIRADTGIWFNEFSSRHVESFGDYSSGDGDVEGMLVPGFYLAQPLGDGFELTGLASFALGAGQFLTYGPGVELGARGVIADQVHLGVLVHVAGWQVEREISYGSDCSGSFCIENIGKDEEIEPFFHAGATGGIFLDPGRQLELGVNFRAGIHTDSEEISIYTTAHVAYLWPVW